MDDRTRVLKLLANRPENAAELARKLGISRNPLFSLLMKMEKEDLIVWTDREWALKPSSDSKPSRAPDSSHPSEGASYA